MIGCVVRSFWLIFLYLFIFVLTITIIEGDAINWLGDIKPSLMGAIFGLPWVAFPAIVIEKLLARKLVYHWEMGVLAFWIMLSSALTVFPPVSVSSFSFRAHGCDYYVGATLTECGATHVWRSFIASIAALIAAILVISGVFGFRRRLTIALPES